MKPNYNQHKLDYCIVCGTNQGLDIAHVLTQGAWPEFKNEDWNCPTLCRNCHIEQGWGIEKFAKKHPRYKAWLDKFKWYICKLTGKFRNKGMEKA